MYNWNEHNKLKTILSQEDSYSEMIGAHQITCHPKRFLRWVEFLKNDLKFLWLVDISFQEKSRIYSFYHYETFQWVHLHLEIQEGEIVPSIENLYSNANWLERENELILPRINDGLLSLPEIKFNPNRSEKPYVEESYVWEKHDFFSPIVDKGFELLTCYHDNKLIDAQVDIGFHHRKLEKSFSQNNFDEILQKIDSINPWISPTYSILFAKSIEESNRIKIPQRAQAIRIILLEMGRVIEHLKVLQNVLHGFEVNELQNIHKFKFRFIDLMRKLSTEGNRISIMIGGVSLDMPFGWISEYRVLSDEFLKVFELFYQSLSKMPKVASVLKQGGVNPKSLIANGVSGPNMRASGINIDYRKTNPFYFYNEIDFEVPVEVNGTSWDRLMIRCQEIIQSILIINQVVDNLPLGEISLEQIDYLQIPEKSFVSSYIETPQGQSGVSWIKAENSHLESIRIITAHLAVIQSIKYSLQGIDKEHLAPHLASLGLNPLEIDR